MTGSLRLEEELGVEAGVEAEVVELEADVGRGGRDESGREEGRGGS